VVKYALLGHSLFKIYYRHSKKFGAFPTPIAVLSIEIHHLPSIKEGWALSS